MIVNAEQYERAMHECLKAAAPTLWWILMSPHEWRTPAKAVTAKQQRKALAELRHICKFPVPTRLLLDDEEPKP